jgi:hypothetical protein
VTHLVRLGRGECHSGIIDHLTALRLLSWFAGHGLRRNSASGLRISIAIIMTLNWSMPDERAWPVTISLSVASSGSAIEPTT